MIRRSLAVLGLLALAACNASDPAANEAAFGNAAVGSVATPVGEAKAAPPRLDEIAEEEPAAIPAKAPDPRFVTRAWFTGRWTDTGDCAAAGNFAANGVYELADGTRGMWNIVDGRLVVQHAAGRGSVALRRIDEDSVEVVNEDGSVGLSKRC